jgi:ABC-type transport system involved in cytochrome c biogenesis ATPase subunit
MAFEKLLSWSSGRPEWQQDALRRLAEHGELSESDLSALRHHIEVTEKLTEADSTAAIPLAAEHLSEVASNEPKTVLASLGPIRNVDRLEPDQSPIRFAINGVTLVYGPNASGKSGYCRITKQLCRSLSPGELRGNVFDAAPPPPAEVAVAFRVGGDEEKKTERTWTSNDSPPPEIARISVFDTASARVYVDKQRKIEFLPYELDLLNKLGLAVRAIDNGFKEREDHLKASLRRPLSTGYTEGTQVSRLVKRLVPETPLTDLPNAQELRGLATWSEEDQSELDTLEEQSKYNPATMARLRREARKALQTVKNDLSTISKKLSDSAIQTLWQKQKDAAAKDAAAQASAHELFGDEPIPGVGSEAWRQMLKYAREFALEVFPDREPPQMVSAKRCVLCQQELHAKASARLEAFDGYLGERAAEDAAAAKAEFMVAVSDIRALSVKSKTDISTLLAGYGELNEEKKQNTETIGTFFESAGERLHAVKQILEEECYEKLGAIDSLPELPLQIIEKEMDALDREAVGFDQLSQDDRAAQRRGQRLAELFDRKKLSEEIDLVSERRNDLEKRHKLAACRVQCRLTSITQQITKRRREILTPSLKEALRNELNVLQLTHVPLDLADRGDLASSIIEVSLSAQQRIAANSEVLSEGEQRGLALACFLAELVEVGGEHGIIVDDPVSSLDHGRMQAVACRLAKEAAKGRQVIVFTHNILFHHMVSSEARRFGVACHEEWMTSLGNSRFGIIDSNQKPWHIRPVTERLQGINQARDSLVSGGYDHTDEAFRGKVTELYASMRTTWERIIEEILFNKSVQRFQPEIKTQSLRTACFDPRHDYPVIFEGMKRTSHYSGHDLAVDLPGELPTLEQIDCDIGELKEFASQARDRRKKLEKSVGSYEKGVEPVLL